MKIDIRSVKPILPNGKNVYIETYGCQMNTSDSEVVVSIMKRDGYLYCEDIKKADVILINTCSIRDNAEQRIWGRLRQFVQIKKKKPSLIIGIIGCMAERLKEQLIEGDKLVDIVVGPDAYRELPTIINTASKGQKGVNIELSIEETYGDISPIRLDKSGITAFIPIMRGCNNFCSYCVVPYTRGAERSGNPQKIISEAKTLIESGYKEITLLGQNVNSYRWDNDGEIIDFPMLITQVADLNPDIRIRFSTSHPKDISDELIETVASHKNICNHIHLPAQSGSTDVLSKMNRKYSREWYLERIAKIKSLIPDCTISTDIIAGFCGETIEQHNETLSLIKEVKYELAYMYKYSSRPDTEASRTMVDDVSEEEKSRRLEEIIAIQRNISAEVNKKDIGKVFEVLIEGVSKRSEEQLYGRTQYNKVVIFPRKNYNIGGYVNVKVTSSSSATLFGESI